MSLSFHRSPTIGHLVPVRLPAVLQSFSRVWDSLKAQLALTNERLRRTDGIEIDLAIAGSYSFLVYLRGIGEYTNNQLYTPNDLDIFVGVRVVDERLANRQRSYFSEQGTYNERTMELGLENINILWEAKQAVSRAIGQSFDRYPSSHYLCYAPRRGTEYEDMEGAEHLAFTDRLIFPDRSQSYQDLYSAMPNLNIIYRTDLISRGFETNLQSLFDSFDLDVCRNAYVITSSNGGAARTLTVRDPSFTEAVTNKLCDFRRDPVQERLEKYQRRLERLGFEWTW